MLLVFALLALVATVVGCGARADVVDVSARGTTIPPAPTTEPDAEPADPNAPIALVVTTSGLAGVPVGSRTPAWTRAGAVAAPDGSAVFATSEEPAAHPTTRVVHLDSRSGDEIGPGIAVAGDLRLAAVAPGGSPIVLARAGGDGTLLVVLDTVTGTEESRRTFEGELDPEAFSTDETRIFAARSFGDHYRVHTLNLATGEQYPTFGPNKAKPPEDMYGLVIQAVLSPDGTQLATLYRDDSMPGRSAFVHLLSLETGMTVCIDLHPPFGAGAPGEDVVRWDPAGEVYVGHATGTVDATAAFVPSVIWNSEPRDHYMADVVPGLAPPALPERIAQTDGFVRFVALALAASASSATR